MQLGLEHAPTLCIDHPGSDVLRTYRIADNHLAELADWDDETLVIELQELQFGRNPLNSCVIALPRRDAGQRPDCMAVDGSCCEHISVNSPVKREKTGKTALSPPVSALLCQQSCVLIATTVLSG